MIGRYISTGIGSLMLACVSSAQLTPAETDINAAIANLRSLDKIYVRLNGYESVGDKSTPFACDFFWSRPNAAPDAQNLQMELVESRDGMKNRRIVADGKHLWGVDLLKNTYSTSRYGSYTEGIPENYVSNALQSLNVLTTGQSVWIGRLCREIWGGSEAMFRPWIPATANRTEMLMQSEGFTYIDPIVRTRTYLSTKTTRVYLYWLSRSGTPYKSVAYITELNKDTDRWDLRTIYMAETTRLDSSLRLVDWQLDIYWGVFPHNGNFVYAPAAGARAIAGPRPNGGG